MSGKEEEEEEEEEEWNLRIGPMRAELVFLGLKTRHGHFPM